MLNDVKQRISLKNIYIKLILTICSQIYLRVNFKIIQKVIIKVKIRSKNLKTNINRIIKWKQNLLLESDIIYSISIKLYLQYIFIVKFLIYEQVLYSFREKC